MKPTITTETQIVKVGGCKGALGEAWVGPEGGRTRAAEAATLPAARSAHASRCPAKLPHRVARGPKTIADWRQQPRCLHRAHQGGSTHAAGALPAPPQTPRVIMSSETVQRPRLSFQTQTVYETKAVTKPVFSMEVGGAAAATPLRPQF
jgi:hypothetical protein